MQPPERLPTTAPLSRIAIWVPAGRGALDEVEITVVSTKPRSPRRAGAMLAQKSSGSAMSTSAGGHRSRPPLQVARGVHIAACGQMVHIDQIDQMEVVAQPWSCPGITGGALSCLASHGDRKDDRMRADWLSLPIF